MLANMLANDAQPPTERMAGRRKPNGFFHFAAAVSEEGKVKARVASLDEPNMHGHIFRRSVWERPQAVVISDWGHSAALEPFFGPRPPVGDGYIALEEDKDGLTVPMLDGLIDRDMPAGGAAHRFARRRGKNQFWSIAYYWTGIPEEDGLNLIIEEAVTDEASMVLRPADLRTYTDEVSAARQRAATASMLTPEQRLAFQLGQEWFALHHLRGEG